MSDSGQHLGRGRACIDCRLRKVKCDGALPACTRCVVGGHGEDCEYADEQGHARIHLLEDSIAKLEAKIAQLEHSESNPASLPPEDPIVNIQIPGRGRLTSSHPSQSLFRLVPASAIQSPAIPPNYHFPDDWWKSPILPLEVAKLLMDIVAPHAFIFAFFLHGPRLIEAMFPSGKHPSSPSPSPNLLSVIYLWGIHLSGCEPLLAHESVFLNRALRYSVHAQHPHHILHNIQAELLLANYLLRQGKFGAAMHRFNSAVSLSISCGLHKQASRHATASFLLPPPRDPIEYGERLDAFWSPVLFLKTLSVELQSSSRVSAIMDDMVNTPFPLEMDAYEAGVVPTNLDGVLTMKCFMDAPSSSAAEHSLTTCVKAAALYERASYLGIEWISVMRDPEEDIQFRTFESHLFNFIRSMPPLTYYNGVGKHSWLVINTTIHAAVIRLHSSRNTVESKQKCLDAARAAVDAILSLQGLKNSNEFQYVNPIMAMLWFTVCEALISAISDLHNIDKDDNAIAQYECLHTLLSTITNTMATFSTNSMGMYSQLLRVRALYKAIQS